MSLKNVLYLSRETCSSVSLKGSQLPWQTDPYLCSTLGWMIWNEHISPPFTTPCTRGGKLPGPSEWRAALATATAQLFHLLCDVCMIKTAVGQHFLGDLPWGWTSLPTSNCHSSIWKKNPQGLVNRCALSIKCITQSSLHKSYSSSLASFLWNTCSLLLSWLIFLFLYPSALLIDYSFFVSFLLSLPPLWQKVTSCSCWEHLPDDCENKFWLVDCWRKWQMTLPKWPTRVPKNREVKIK